MTAAPENREDAGPNLVKALVENGLRFFLVGTNRLPALPAIRPVVPDARLASAANQAHDSDPFLSSGPHGRFIRNVSSEEKSLKEFAALLGRRGGLKGGRVRAERLSPERRKAIARKAAKARWARARTKKGRTSTES